MQNPKPDGEFLPDSKPEVFNKTEHGLRHFLTVIIWDEFNPI